MFRKILLIICLAFVVVCYGYPCFILPFGNYTYKTSDNKQESISFKFNGTATATSSSGTKTEYKYKINFKDNTITLTPVDSGSEVTMTINNMYSVGFLVNFENNIGKFIMLGVGILSLVLIVTIPRRD